MGKRRPLIITGAFTEGRAFFHRVAQKCALILRGSGRITSPLASKAALAGWSQLVWFIGLSVIWSVLILTLPIDPDYTSGELLDHLESWRASGVLYPELSAEAPYRVLNYPPLVLVLARGLAGLGLSGLLAGRLVNLLGGVVLVASVTWWSRSRGVSGARLAGTVGLMGASFPVLYGLGGFHLEIWAAAGTVAGFALLDRGSSRWAVVFGGIALAMACFAKQTQVVPAVVALAWVASHRRSMAPVAVAAFAGSGVLGSGLITHVWGLEAWRHMLTYTVGTFSLPNLGFQAVSHVAPWLILFAFFIRSVRADKQKSSGDIVLWYWCGALLWSFSAARIGSSYSYFVDLHIATVMWVGPRMFDPLSEGRAIVWRWLLALQVVGANVGVGAVLATNLSRLRGVQEELPPVCALLEGQRDVLAEEAGLVRACGHASLIHPFIMSSLASRGLWDLSPLEAELRAGAYPLALLPFDPREPIATVHAERWHPALLAAFAAAPSVEAVGPGRWLVRW